MGVNKNTTWIGGSEGALTARGRQRLRSGILRVDGCERQWGCHAQLVTVLFDQFGCPLWAAVLRHELAPTDENSPDFYVRGDRVDNEIRIEILVLLATFIDQPVQVLIPGLLDLLQMVGRFCQLLFLAVVEKRAVLVAGQLILQLGRNGSEVFVELFAKVRLVGHNASSHGSKTTMKLGLFYNFLSNKSIEIDYA
jgi:hypothetical protein